MEVIGGVFAEPMAALEAPMMMIIIATSKIHIVLFFEELFIQRTPFIEEDCELTQIQTFGRPQPPISNAIAPCAKNLQNLRSLNCVSPKIVKMPNDNTSPSHTAKPFFKRISEPIVIQVNRRLLILQKTCPVFPAFFLNYRTYSTLPPLQEPHLQTTQHTKTRKPCLPSLLTECSLWPVPFILTSGEFT